MIKTFIQILLFCTFNLALAQQSQLSKSVNELSEYIGSDEFIKLKNHSGDLVASDSLFRKAILICNNDIGDALLTLMFAAVPYREIPIKIPIINCVINYPLVSADEKTFLLKNANLPRYLFIDSPDDEYGDKDKLAHFFGSAFLEYESHFFDLGKLIGYFVEVFEESFKVQSTIDNRDLDVNDYGRLFGKLLKTNDQLLPSNIFLIRSLRFIRVKL